MICAPCSLKKGVIIHHPSRWEYGICDVCKESDIRVTNDHKEIENHEV